ncbi:predicted protein [Chaetoceros tenuissimus]|uniref:Uncharacterized protein n=1 Tax=Chaetoceros tenuissimus TaxID=426638 RepID=A0AAD3D649_9STRA|nr:predicted protein [Chaetoceros tenuissimus]
MTETDTNNPPQAGSTAAASSTSQDPLTPLYKMSRLSGDSMLSGGVQNASWDALVSHSKYNVLQVCSFKREKDAKNIKYLAAKFNSSYEQFDHLSAFVKDALICSVQRGLDTITYLPREDKVDLVKGTIDASAEMFSVLDSYTFLNGREAQYLKIAKLNSLRYDDGDWLNSNHLRDAFLASIPTDIARSL